VKVETETVETTEEEVVKRESILLDSRAVKALNLARQLERLLPPDAERLKLQGKEHKFYISLASAALCCREAAGTLL
jgi:uncharacterized protein with von Willebrand factor type A (vWA) domain